MIKEIMKKVIIVFVATITLNTVNCFATTITNEELYRIDNIDYIKRTYSIPTDEEKNFLLSLENEFKIEKKTYQLQDNIKTGGNIIDTIDIETTRTIKLDSNKTDKILQQLPQEIEYNQNEFIGKYQIDINSIEIKNQYNGYKEYLVEDTKEYTKLSTNDLDNIPKQVMKDGMILDLTKIKWEVTSTRQLQDNTIPSEYKAICYYSTKKKVDNPLTYIVTARYKGTADKIIKNDYIYEITYKCVKADKNIYPTLFAFGSTTLIVVVLFFTRKKNVTIYNFQNKEWKEIGKQRIIRPLIKLNKYNYKSVSNRYKIIIDEKFIDKYNGKLIKFIRNDRAIEKLINKSNNITPYTIDIAI